MANQEYQVRITAETRQAKDKIEAVQNSVNALTDKQNIIRVGVDANAARRAAEHTEDIANNIKRTTQNIKEGGGFNIVSGASLSSAASLASQFYGIRKDVKGLNQDLGKALGKTNISEFMRTEEFLERVLNNSRARSKEIVETYANIRELPGATAVLGPIENYTRAQAWQQFGGKIAEQTLKGVQAGLQQGVVETKRFFYGEVFEDIARGTNATIDTLARLGLAIQGVQLLVGPLAAAWGAAFNQIIGQNVRLQEVILSTQTTLASTGRVIDNNTGKELLDPLEKINALGGDVEKAIANIRVRSLDLAGVTSQQIIDIFGVVATSISQVNGNIKDAEDLAISFTAALGTLGIPFYQARQEIGSILGGYITEDSLLAKRLQISNADINKARNSIDGVVGYLQKKLEVAVAGQAISAKSFSGVLSNIQEVFENIAQRLGEPLLKPIVGGLTAVYNFMKDIQGVVVEVGGYLSKTFVSTITGIVNIFKQSTLVQSISDSIGSVAKPFKEVARSIELGLSGPGLGVIDSWVTGLEKIPRAFEGLINGLIKLGNFLKLQIDLITKPIIQLLDQTRDRLSGVAGAVQGLARMPQFIFFEGPDAFTKGWDTIASTIQYAAQALSKFAVAVIQLKITEFTAKLRAAATVFELFGSLVLGKLNLALSFFDFLGNIAGSDLAKFTVSLLAINKLINNTEFFGLKGLFQFLAAQRPIFQRFIKDIDLFAKGFKDAGNIDNYVKSLQEAQAKLLQTQALSKDPVVANTANIRILTKELNDLRVAQVAAVKAQADPGIISKQAEQIKSVNAQLREANTLQRQFTLGQRASAAARLATGTGDTAAAQEALRQAGIVTSGAAAAQAVKSSLRTLGERIGLAEEQMKGLGGAFNVATKSIKTFITTSLAINIVFTGLSLAIAGVMSWMQQLEEAEKKRQTEAYRTSQVNKILASSYEGLRKAAAGGDLAAQRRLEDDREAANAAFQIQQEKKAKLIEEDIKLNNQLAQQRTNLRNTRNNLVDQFPPLGVIAPGDMFGGTGVNPAQAQAAQIKGLTLSIADTEKQRLAIKQKIAEVDREIYRINQAQAKVSEIEAQQDQYTILAERRRDIEQKIQDTRKDYLKEITDKEFQAKIEVLNLEQQKRREIQEKELAALRERFTLLANNATQQDQKIISLVQNYEQALIEAANAEGNRRSELFIKEQQLRKEIEDYAFKMAKEKVALEKQIGNYQKEVEKWRSRQVRIRAQEELQLLRQRKVLEGHFFEPYNPEQQQAFTNAAQQNRLNTPDAYTLLQLIPKDTLGITGTEDIKVIMARLVRVLNILKQRGAATDPVGIARDQGYSNPDSLVSKLRSEAIQSLNLNRWFVRQDPNDVRIPDLSIDWTGMQKRLEDYNRTIIDATRSLQESQAANDNQKIIDAINRFADPSVYTDTKSDYFSDLNSAILKLSTVTGSIVNESKGVASLQDEINEVIQRFSDSLRMAIKSVRGMDKASQQVVEDLIATSIKFGRTDQGAEAVYGVLDKANITDERTRTMLINIIGQSLKGRDAAIGNIRNTYADRQLISTTNQVANLNSDIASKILDTFSTKYADAFNRFNEAVAASVEQSYSLAKAQADIRKEVLLYLTTELSKIKGLITPEQMQQIQLAAKKYEQTLLTQAEAFDPFNKALETYNKKLALSNSLTDVFVGNTKTLFTDILLNQKNVMDAFGSFAESINKELAGMFIDSVMETYRKQMFEQIKKFLKVPDLEDQARKALATAADNLQGAAKSHENAAAALTDAAAAISRAASGDTAAPSGGAAASSPTSPDPKSLDPATVGRTLNAPIKETGKWIASFGNVIAAAIPAITGFGMALSGIAQIRKGGTYNTLMGLASIFGSLSSFTGMFSPGGMFGRARALGGPVLSNTPYLVGERGPELFMPSFSGQIIPADKTADMLAQTRQSLVSARPPENGPAESTNYQFQPINVRYESQVINSVEYVTAEQHRKGMQEAARRGQLLAYQGMQHSVKVRRRLGL